MASQELEEQLTLACRGEHVQFVPAKRVVALWGCQPWLLEREDLQARWEKLWAPGTRVRTLCSAFGKMESSSWRNLHHAQPRDFKL